MMDYVKRLGICRLSELCSFPLVGRTYAIALVQCRSLYRLFWLSYKLSDSRITDNP